MAPPQRAAAPQPFSAPRPATAPQPAAGYQRPQVPAAGYQRPQVPAAGYQRPQVPAAGYQRPQVPAARAQLAQPAMQQRGRPNGTRIAVRNNPPRQMPGNIGARRRISNPSFHGNAWGWNRGVTWNPAPTYWGGGFWGTLAFSATAAFFGELISSGQTYESYEVYPDSPGATLLANYQLTQTPCGPPDLVVIWGPDSSLICAFPNDMVGPGEYDIDPSTLTLVSE
jgi:hypothetical protein